MTKRLSPLQECIFELIKKEKGRRESCRISIDRLYSQVTDDCSFEKLGRQAFEKSLNELVRRMGELEIRCKVVYFL